MNQSNRALATSYDETPYPGRAYTQTHPDHLAALATLLGLTPANVARCRVLEIGCATGGNLLPMALGLPDATFVGIDISVRQIAAAQEAVDALGLTNVTLRACDILELDDDFDQFDFIIAHGIYSWVPAPVRDKLLAISKHSLTPNGIAYISYNTYPGWHMLGALRDMMLYRTAETADPQERAAQSIALLDLLVQSGAESENAFSSFLGSYAERLRSILNQLGAHGAPFLVHDALEIVNEPVYFAQFIDHAARYGLQYLSETEFPMVLPLGFKPETIDAIRSISRSGIDLEQYMDFVRGRQFRQTLLCHDHLSIQRTLRPDRLANLAITALLRPEQQPVDLTGDAPVVFRDLHGIGFTVSAPITKAALTHLAAESPVAVRFDTLLLEARRRLIAAGMAPAALDVAVLGRRLGGDLLRAFSSATTLVSFHAYPPLVARDPGAYPAVTAWARREAVAGAEVTNLFHDVLALSPFDRQLLQLLDGSRDRAALERDMAIKIASGGVQLGQEDAAAVADLAAELERRLLWFGEVALFPA